MDREGFRNRMKQYKKAREQPPGLKYWEWRGIPKYDEGTGSVSSDAPSWRKRPSKEQLDTFWAGNV